MKRIRTVILALPILFGAAAVSAAGTRDLFDWRNRFLEGDWPNVEAVPSVLVVDSFEDEERITKDWKPSRASVARSNEHTTEGKHSLKVVFAGRAGELAYLRASWGGFPFIRQMNFFDELRLDVFNPGAPVELSVKMVNRFRFPLKPGHNGIRIATRDMKKGRLMHFNLNPDCVLRLDAPPREVELYLDNLRWIGPGLGRNLLQSAKCYDFGPASYCRPQFLPVTQATAYAPGRGYGWEKPHAPKHRYDQRQFATYTYNPASDLVGDLIRGMDSALRIDLAPGKYRMHLVEGHVGYLDPQVSYWDLGLRIDDGEPVVLRRGARTFDEFVRFEYGREQTDWSPGDDRWQSTMACRHRPFEHDFEVKGDHVRIRFVSDPPGMAQLAFMIVYPLDKAEVIEPELAAMWREIRGRFNNHAFGPIPRRVAERLSVPGFHSEYLDPQTCTRRLDALKVDDAERRRGVVLFHREPVDEVYPDTVPSPDERTSKLAAFGPPGEIETFTVSLFAVKNVEDARIELSDFAGPGGKVIPATRADVRVVNCTCEMTARESHGDWSYIPKPRWLVKRDAVDVPANTSRRFWVNVDIPPDTPAGKYVARATVRSKNVQASTLDLELEVLPFRLDAVPEGIEHGVNITYPYHPLIDRELLVFLSRRPRLLQDERWKTLAGEAGKAHAARIDAEFDLIRRCGFRKVWMDGSYVRNVPLTPERTHGLDVVRYTQRSAGAVLSEGVAFLPLEDFTRDKIAKSLAAGKKAARLRRGADSI
ncbi:MAG: hypothetical protein AMK75_05825, partial [Planctomycetes bacterium SM23_65]